MELKEEIKFMIAVDKVLSESSTNKHKKVEKILNLIENCIAIKFSSDSKEIIKMMEDKVEKPISSRGC